MFVARRVAALVLGAFYGFAFLTQPLPIAAVVGVVALLVVLHWDQAAAAALIAGIGVAFVIGAAVEPSAGWLLLGVSVAGAAALAVAQGARRQAEPRPSFAPPWRIVGGFVVMSVVFGLVGLPMRPGERPLRTSGWSPQWLGFGCGGVGLNAVVRADPSDPNLVWLESEVSLPDVSSGQRVDVVWPFGYRARFTPSLEVLDSWGNVVLRAGDHVSESCGGVGDDNLLHMAPPFN